MGIWFQPKGLVKNDFIHHGWVWSIMDGKKIHRLTAFGEQQTKLNETLCLYNQLQIF